MSGPLPASENRRGNSRSFCAIALIAALLFLISYFVFVDNVEFVNVDSYFPHATALEKATYFERRILTNKEIDEGLNDITIVNSEDVGDIKRGKHSYVNEVYFVRNHVVVQWGDTDNAAALATGKWRTTPWLQLLYWRGRVRLVTNHLFCLIMPTSMPPNEPICTVASDLNYLQGLIMPPHTEIRKGDIFNLERFSI